MHQGQKVTVTAHLWRGVMPMPQKDWTDEQRKLVKQTAWVAIVDRRPSSGLYGTARDSDDR